MLNFSCYLTERLNYPCYLILNSKRILAPLILFGILASKLALNLILQGVAIRQLIQV
jgi:hypothetical protein